jgi:hypothetical protein
METSDRQEMFNMEMPAAVRLGEASRRVGGLEALTRMWPFWPEFASGPFTALFGMIEAQLRDKNVDLAELIALGPEPSPSRPNKDLRQAVGVMLAMRRLEKLPEEVPVTPNLVSEVFQNIDAPQLARSQGVGLASSNVFKGVLPGGAVWTLAPKWIHAGLPTLWAMGLALASWEKEGPQHPNRGVSGRVLLAGLAMRLGLPYQAFYYLGPYLEIAASGQPGGYAGLVKSLRGSSGSWRLFAEVFLAAVKMSAAQAVEIIVKIQQIHEDHRSLIKAWVRAPQNPMRLLGLLVERPVVDLPLVSQKLEVTQRTAGLLVGKLEDLGLLVEITGQRRGRKYAYKQVIALLQPGWGEEEE